MDLGSHSEESSPSEISQQVWGSLAFWLTLTIFMTSPILGKRVNCISKYYTLHLMSEMVWHVTDNIF